MTEPSRAASPAGPPPEPAHGDWAATREHLLARRGRDTGAAERFRLAEAEAWLGDNAAALRGFRAAHARALRDGDIQTAAMAAIWMYFLYRASLGNVAAARGWAARLRRLVDDHDAEPLRGWVLLLAGHDRCESGDAEAGEPFVSRALAHGVAVGDDDLRLSALGQLGGLRVLCGRVAEGMELLDEAMAGALGADGISPDTVVFTSCTMMDACARAAEFARAAQWISAASDFAARFESLYLHTSCRLHLGEVLAGMGRWPEAEYELSRAIVASREAEPVLWEAATVAFARLRIAQGRIDEAADLLGGMEGAGAAALPLSAIALERGEPEAAAVLARRRLRAAGDDLIARAEAVEMIGECETALGTTGSALRRARELRRAGLGAGCDLVVARAERTIGRALCAAGRPAGAGHLEEAVARFGALPMPFEVARCQLDLAGVLAAPAPRAAVAEARAAAAGFDALGAVRLRDRAHALLRALGERPAAAGPRPAGTLSRREREVLGLLASGLSNREIAERLYLSRRTVEHHVHHILGKLGLRNRAEAAAYALRDRDEWAPR